MKEKIAKILLEIKAVTLNLETGYRFVSGIYSPIYTDNRLLMSYPEKRKIIANGFRELIKAEKLEFDVIAGVATSGIPHAAWLADLINKPMVYVRADKKEHGKQNLIEGKLEGGQRVIVIEDLVSTGGSSVAVVNALKEAGAEIVCCLAIFTYEFEKARKYFEDAECPLITLTNFSTLIKVAEEERYITEEQKENALEWNKNPEEWGRKMGFEQ